MGKKEEGENLYGKNVLCAWYCLLDEPIFIVIGYIHVCDWWKIMKNPLTLQQIIEKFGNESLMGCY